MDNNTKKRTMNSAIPNISVASVRKALAVMRELWDKNEPNNPIYLCSKVHEDMSLEEFSFKFILGHHVKRTSKDKKT